MVASPSDKLPPSAHHASVFASSFDEETRHRLAAEDSQAWRSVTGLLLAIVTGGVLIAVMAVILCTLIVMS
jgi:hypothetical protein